MFVRYAALCLATLTLTAAASPVHLRTEQQTNPLALSTDHPRFSWRSDASTPGWLQSAYEITVSDSAGHKVWDSGRVANGASVDIAYAGPALAAHTQYRWQVATWDTHGLRTVSLPATFELGLRDADWSAQWIGRDDPAEDRELADVRWLWLPGMKTDQVPGGTKADFRYTLHLDAVPTHASLHVVSRGRYTASVNGHVTGSLEEWSAFDYEEITKLLHAGDNEVLLHVVAPGGAKAKGHAATAAVIRIADAAGNRSIVSDGTWQVRGSENSAWEQPQVVGPIALPYSVGVDRNTPVAGPTRVTTTASLLRKPFALRGRVQSARLYVTALGGYSAFLNGKAVAPSQLLQPGFVDFDKRVLYQAFDVTSLLVPGNNVLGAILAGGWHSSPLTWTGNRFFAGPDLLRAQLELTLADGSHQTIVSDGSWHAAPSPILSSEIYGGEVFDGRQQISNWSEPAFNASHWTSVFVGQPVKHPEMTALPALPLATQLTLHPTTIAPANGTHPAVYDMGQNMVGNIRIHVHGPRGGIVRLRYAERLNPDGSIYTENLRNATATDIYVLAGTPNETYTPAFTFHGFRYVEVSGDSGPLTLASIEGLVQNSLPLAPSIRFHSSSELLNHMGQLGIWGQRGNFVSLPTDCPQRDERLGWMGDAGVFWRTGTYQFDVAGFTQKFMLDIVDSQSHLGSFTDVSPDILARDVGAPGWADAGIFIPYAAWQQYGDTSLLERHWAAMQRYMQFIESGNPDHIRRKQLGENYGDWLAPDPHTPRDLIATAYWALVAREMGEMATALHRPEDAAAYNELYGKIVDAYRKTFVHTDGLVQGDTQTVYAATLFAGLAPDDLRANITDRLVKNIAEHGNHLTTGFLGTPLLLPALTQNGHIDLAYKLLLSDTYPSWGYMVAKGATTWWERWNGDTGDPSMNSYNHYAFGSVMAWVFRSVAGIDTDVSGAGFQHPHIEPHFDPALPSFHAEYDSTYGTITTIWDAATHHFTVTTPPNTTATVLLPGGQPQTVLSGTHIYTISK